MHIISPNQDLQQGQRAQSFVFTEEPEQLPLQAPSAERVDVLQETLRDVKV